MNNADILAQLLRDRPVFHGGGTTSWDATKGTLELIARVGDELGPEAHTLETGCGASTVVFAASGAHHVAISPFPDEHRRILAYCRDQLHVDVDSLEFLNASSADALPALRPDSPLDCVFIDGAHSFPYPVLDFQYATALLRVGGTLILDDVPIPAVHVVYEFLKTSEEWELVEVADRRAAAFEKRAEPPGGDFWQLQGFNRAYPVLSFLGPIDRLQTEIWFGARSAKRKLTHRYPRMGSRLDALRGRGGRRA
jgi:predicted O-methyltransferase YrrM